MYKLIHRDNDFIVVAKAAGVSFHRQDAACGLVAKIKTDLCLPEIYPVHRLDKITSGLRLFILKPRTGRTHQLRVAMKSIAAPVLGDGRYGKVGLDIDRAYLHSYAIRFSVGGSSFSFTTLPVTGRLFLVPDSHAALDDYLSPWDIAWPQLKK